MRKRNEDFSFKELVNIFLPKLWLIMVISLVFGAAMAVYSKVIKEESYTATSKIHVVKKTTSSYGLGDVEFASTYLETYMEVITMPKFLTAVVEEFKTNHHMYELYEGEFEAKGWQNLNYSKIRGMISCSAKQDILTISVTSSSSSLSYGIAKSIANVLENQELEFLAYPKELVQVKPLQTPEGHPHANSRKVVLNTLIGLVVGGVLALAVVFIINMYDVIIHDKKKIEDNFNIPILGVIPRFLTDEGRLKNEKEN